jgi:uncharacterized protein (TIGR02588 family)
MTAQEIASPTAPPDPDQPAETQPAAQDNAQISPWEWLIAALGLLLVAGTIGFMLHRALTGGDAPPQIRLEIASVEPVGSGYLVTFTATNQGDTVAADLQIAGTLGDGPTATETSTATIAYLPAGSSRAGGLYFTQDPRQHPLTLRATGYEQP